uniref:Uncharacterized protein n=2 Tax=Aegilops tauschii subsp. strangulata TaxID=200361 RepID=A0A453BLV6_AEGTS
MLLHLPVIDEALGRRFLLLSGTDPTTAAMARRLHLSAKDHHLPDDVPNPDEARRPWSSCRDASTSCSAMDSCHHPRHQEHDCKRYKLQFQGNLSQILFRFRAGGEGRTSGCMMETMMHGRTDLESEFFMEYGEINRYQVGGD